MKYFWSIFRSQKYNVLFFLFEGMIDEHMKHPFCFKFIRIIY